MPAVMDDGMDTPVKDTQCNYKDYACPECSNPDMLKVRYIEVKSRKLVEYGDDPEYIRYIQKDLARALGDFIAENKDSFVVQTETYQKEWAANEVKWSIGLLTSDSATPTFTAQVDEGIRRGIEKEVRNIQMVTKEKIYGWNMHSEGLAKDQAVICLNEAIMEVLG